MKTISYKGFQASVAFDDGALFVKVLHIDDVLVAQVDAASAAEAALKELVDAYLDDCKELGKDPQKPFSGTFNVRVGADLHRRAAMAAAEEGKTLNAWIEDAIRQKAAPASALTTSPKSAARRKPLALAGH
jgi:predicted HicB family RNase H-like nuclease